MIIERNVGHKAANKMVRELRKEFQQYSFGAKQMKKTGNAKFNITSSMLEGDDKVMFFIKGWKIFNRHWR